MYSFPFSYPLPFVLLLFLTACGPSYLYQETRDLPDVGWTYADSLSFDFTIDDTLSIYNLNVTVDHGTDYPYQNLYVRLHTRFPDGQRLTEQVSLELAGKAGNWLGDCDSEDCSLLIPIQTDAYFNQAGNYRLTIQQFMRRDTLAGVEAVTFGVEDTGKRRQ